MLNKKYIAYTNKECKYGSHITFCTKYHTFCEDVGNYCRQKKKINEKLIKILSR